MHVSASQCSVTVSWRCDFTLLTLRLERLAHMHAKDEGSSNSSSTGWAYVGALLGL
jgi:hypothetical protein